MTERPVTKYRRNGPIISYDVQFIVVFCCIGFLLALTLMLFFPDISAAITLPD